MLRHPFHERWRAHVWRTASALLALCFLAVLPACSATTPGGNTPTPTTTPGGGTPTPTATPAPFTVTSVDLSVNPASIADKTCGSRATLTYTAVFHIPAHTAGGTIQFVYTLNNGRSETPGTVTVSPNETSKTFTFVSSGMVGIDYAYPQPAEVVVISPSSVHSPSVIPTGNCIQPAAFHVTSVSMSVTPSSLDGLKCGAVVTVTYTALFHLAPNGPGGTIQFEYTINNGRGSNPASITVAAGQTTATYSFVWSGALPADHTYPQPGGVMVLSPNAVGSTRVWPTGACS